MDVAGHPEQIGRVPTTNNSDDAWPWCSTHDGVQAQIGVRHSASLLPAGLINITATEPVIDKREPPLDGSYVPRLGGGDFFRRALSIYLDSGVARSSGGLITRPT
jgi:hypothetical protein